MPMYDFRCTDCGTEFEELVPRDYKDVPCPDCQSVTTERQLSVFASRTGGLSSGFAPSGGGGGCAPGG